MVIEKGHTCRNIGEFHGLLISWLSQASGQAIGVGNKRGWVTVPIDGIECQLAADTTRAGVETYLAASLGLPAPQFGVVASSKGVVERIGVGIPPVRIPGFYLYASHPIFEEVEIRPFDPAFDLVDVALLLLRAVRVLHREGWQRLRIFPGISGSGMHWRTSITYPENFVVQEWGLDLANFEMGYFWTTGEKFEVAGMTVDRRTTPEALARALQVQLDMNRGWGTDPAYAAWFSRLVDAANRLRRLPVAYNGAEPTDLTWELEGDVRYALPPAAERGTR